MVWALNRWNLREKLERMMRNERLNRSFLYQIGRVRFIQRTFRQLSRKWAICERIAKRGQSIFRMKRVQDRAYERILGLNSRDRKSKRKTVLLFKKTEFDLIARIGLVSKE